MVKFALKLKRVKKKLQALNKDAFGRVDQKVRWAKDRVFQLEVTFEANPLEENKRSLRKVKIDLDNMLRTEERYWRQKANIK